MTARTTVPYMLDLDAVRERFFRLDEHGEPYGTDDDTIDSTVQAVVGLAIAERLERIASHLDRMHHAGLSVEVVNP